MVLQIHSSENWQKKWTKDQHIPCLCTQFKKDGSSINLIIRNHKSLFNMSYCKNAEVALIQYNLLSMTNIVTLKIYVCTLV